MNPTIARSKDDHHSEFCQFLPRVETHARIHFRGVVDPNQRDDAVSEAVGLAWVWYIRLIRRGKDPNRFISVLADYAVRHVRAGRKVGGQEKSKDAMSRTAQQRHGFRVEKYSNKSTMGGNLWEEALQENRRSSIPDQVVFRVDFKRWLQTLTVRERSIAKAMMMGHTTKELAERFKISPTRISQIRRELHKSWTQFCHDDEEAPTPLAHA